jgi:hypothetical protein
MKLLQGVCCGRGSLVRNDVRKGLLVVAVACD